MFENQIFGNSSAMNQNSDCEGQSHLPARREQEPRAGGAAGDPSCFSFQNMFLFLSYGLICSMLSELIYSTCLILMLIVFDIQWMTFLIKTYAHSSCLLNMLYLFYRCILIKYIRVIIDLRGNIVCQTWRRFMDYCNNMSVSIYSSVHAKIMQ